MVKTKNQQYKRVDKFKEDEGMFEDTPENDDCKIQYFIRFFEPNFKNKFF